MQNVQKKAYIIVHGFLANAKSVEPLKKELLKYNIDENDIYTPYISNRKYVDMIDSLEKTILKISKKYKKICVIGYSMGGLITLGVMIKYQKKLRSVSQIVLLNAPIKIWSAKNFIYTVKVSEAKKKVYHIKTVLSSFKPKKIYYNVELTRLRRYIANNLNKIKIPAYVVQMKYDYVAKPQSGRYIYNNIRSREKVYKEYDTGTHFVPDDNADTVIKDLVNYLQIVK